MTLKYQRVFSVRKNNLWFVIHAIAICILLLNQTNVRAEKYESYDTSILWVLDKHKEINPKGGSGDMVSAKIPLDSEGWYEVVLRYQPLPIEDNERGDLLLVDVGFMAQNLQLKDFLHVPGLRINFAGQLYRYVPTKSAIPKPSDGPEIFRFQFFSPHAADEAVIKILPWKNEAVVTLLSMEVLRVPTIGDMGQRVIRRMPEQSATKFIDLEIPGGTVIEETPFFVSVTVSDFTEAILDGSVIAEGVSERNRALVSVRFYDSSSHLLPQPYAGTTHSDLVGPYIYLPSREQNNSFSLTIPIPPKATELRLGVRSWGEAKGVAFSRPPSLSLKRDDTGLMYHLKAAGIAAIDGSIPQGWLADDVMVNRWLRYWDSKTNASEQNCRTLWFESDPSENLVFPVNHGVLVSGGFYDAMSVGLLNLSGFESYQIMSPPDWTADPFKSKSWRQRYQSLYWLAEISTVFPEVETKERTSVILNSWFAKNSWPYSLDPYAWDDHTLAMRVEGLVNLIRGRSPRSGDHLFSYNVPTLVPQLRGSPDLRKKIAAQMLIDGLLLEDIIDSPSFYAHNHTLFHVNALLALVAAFPDMPNAEHWYIKALGRLDGLIDELWSVDGVSIEQSSAYQIWKLMTVLPMYQNLVNANVLTEEQQEKFRSRIELAMIVATNLIDPMGGCVRIGDSPRYDNAKEELRLLAKFFLPHSKSQIIKDFAVHGTLPMGAYVFDGGYAVFRSNNTEERFFLIDFSPQAYSHGHYDLGGFSYKTGSNSWVIDAGGPFNYGTLTQRQLAGSSSHNVAWPMGIGQADGYAEIDPLIVEPEFWIFSLKTNVYGSDIQHCRVFIIHRDLMAVGILDIFISRNELPMIISSVLFDKEVEIYEQEFDSLILKHNEKLLNIKIIPEITNGIYSMVINESIITPSIGKITNTKMIKIEQKNINDSSSIIGYAFGVDSVVINKVKSRLISYYKEINHTK